ncbi:pantoate--beta-alanine ligase, partial [Escherichia coli]|nr:pantoate--beta-alanine ligase [Escherichia coli]
AFFGEKDWQQLAVIRRMTLDLNLPVEIQSVLTQRDDDGLALSSRNAYLMPEERAKAVALPRALGAAGKAIAEGSDVEAALAQARET